MTEINKSKVRLSREDWLDEALNILATEGNRLLTIESLCNRLGVSRGSFYWHFKSRDEFLSSIVDHWIDQSTMRITEELSSVELSARDRLFKLVEFIQQDEYCKHELPIRLWAIKQPNTLESIQRMDRKRYEFVRAHFEEMGFSGDELEMRTQTFVIYYSFQNALSIDMNEDTDIDTLRHQHQLRLELLTQRCD
jgi:AcrR family transcriptional regulator